MSSCPQPADLWLLHWPRPSGGTALPVAAAADLGRHGLYLETCLRRLLLGVGPRPAIPAGPVEVFTGVEAWQMTLEIITGLRSAVPGESNVLGQFRSAWRAAAGTSATGQHAALLPVPGPALPGPAILAPLVEALLADARAVRRSCLQGVGGSSYGSLVRRLLSPPAGAPVLFIGSGELARSMIPLFRHCRVGVWNYRAGPALPGAERRFAPHETSIAAGWAEYAILTTPADDAHDAAWNAEFRSGTVRRLVHLGRRRAVDFPWDTNRGQRLRTWDLDDVFELARSRQNVRSLQLARARQACARHAAERIVQRTTQQTNRQTSGSTARPPVADRLLALA